MQTYIPCHLGLKRLDPGRQQITDPTATICLSNERRKCHKTQITPALHLHCHLDYIGFLCQTRDYLRLQEKNVQIAINVVLYLISSEC